MSSIKERDIDVWNLDTKSLEWINKRFDRMCKRNGIKEEDKEDMRQDWLLRQLLKKPGYYINYAPASHFRSKHFNYEFVSSNEEQDSIYDSIPSIDKVEEIVQVKFLVRDMIHELGKGLTSIFFHQIEGLSQKEMSAFYKVSRPTIRKRLERLATWLERKG